MTWQIEWDEKARKELKSIDHPNQKKILAYLKSRATKNPRNFGKQLSGNKTGLWRYRIENFRVICRLQDNTLTVLVLAVGHRKEVYS